MRKPLILVIDDEPGFLRMMKDKALDSDKYRVLTALDHEEGLELAAACRPDCILVDYYLKAFKAVNFCKAVRSDQNLKKTPIIVISGDPTRNIESEESCQADRFIVKGVPLAEYGAAINSLLRRVSWERGILERDDLRLQANGGFVSRDGELLAQLSDERFRLFALLVERSPEFVTEDDICRSILRSAPSGKNNAVKVLMYRLRGDLGLLARRIRNVRNKGWMYLSPANAEFSGEDIRDENTGN